MFNEFQDEYTDFKDNQIVLTYGAFDSKVEDKASKIRKLPEHLWFENNIIPVGAQMFSFSKIPLKFQFPKSMSTIVYSMFYDSIVSNNFKIPNSISKIGDAAMGKVKFGSSFRLPSSIKVISSAAFINTKLPIGFKIPNSVTFDLKFVDVNPFDPSSKIPNAHWEPQDPNGYPQPGSILKSGN